MRLLQYDGQSVEVSARHPEYFTVLAPKPLQRICKLFGGTHGTDVANFRLVLCSSRYYLSGGHQVNLAGCLIPTEIFLPRYHVSPAHHGLYVLELWRSPEELMREGYGFKTVEFDEYGEGIRCEEPIWADGCYEAVWNGPGNPFVFPRDVPTDVIEWAIWLVKLRVGMDVEAMMKKRKELDAAKKSLLKKATIYELSQKRRVNCGEPFVSMVGAYKES